MSDLEKSTKPNLGMRQESYKQYKGESGSIPEKKKFEMVSKPPMSDRVSDPGKVVSNMNQQNKELVLPHMGDLPHENDEDDLKQDDQIPLRKKAEPLCFDELLPEDSDTDETQHEETFTNTNHTRKRAISSRPTAKVKISSCNTERESLINHSYSRKKTAETAWLSVNKSTKISPEQNISYGELHVSHAADTSALASPGITESSINPALLGSLYATKTGLLKVYLNNVRTRQEKKIHSAILKRKLARIISFFLFVCLALGIFLLISYFIYAREIHQFSSGNAFHTQYSKLSFVFL